mmetsp:Transcript_19198/g.48233  ORF Transcript_19198/g.48233 Transcript_19198/m.48233 type:complete len:227 (-) Transcript_19198:280-960(-)
MRWTRRSSPRRAAKPARPHSSCRPRCSALSRRSKRSPKAASQGLCLWSATCAAPTSTSWTSLTCAARVPRPWPSAAACSRARRRRPSLGRGRPTSMSSRSWVARPTAPWPRRRARAPWCTMRAPHHRWSRRMRRRRRRRCAWTRGRATRKGCTRSASRVRVRCSCATRATAASTMVPSDAPRSSASRKASRALSTAGACSARWARTRPPSSATRACGRSRSGRRAR